MGAGARKPHGLSSVAWVIQMGTEGHAANAWSVAVDGAGNIVIVGDQSSIKNDRHVFARKLDPEGNTAWIRDVDVLDVGYDILFAVAIDSQDQPVIGGRVRNDGGPRRLLDAQADAVTRQPVGFARLPITVVFQVGTALASLACRAVADLGRV